MDSQTFNDTQTGVKKPISPILRKMNVGDSEEYDVKRLVTIKQIIQDLQNCTDMRFSTKIERPSVKVTRTK